MKTTYKTIVISDVHLGTSGSKAKEVTSFLKTNTCEHLIMNGDIVDGWRLTKGSKWKKKHTRFFSHVLKMAANGTKVTYLRGNHDDFLDHVIPLNFGKINVVREMIYESFGKRYYIIHGDVFDSITSNMRWIAQLGDIGYTFLLWLNQKYNIYRTKRGLPYYSLSQKVKAKVKSAVSYIDDFEHQLISLASAKKYDGIICGHIHQPALKKINGIAYLNSGDWVESLTALVEDHMGQWKIVHYEDPNDYIAEKKQEAHEEDEVEDVSFDELLKEIFASKSLFETSATP